MPRPTTKAELIKAADEQYQSMWKLVDSITDNAQSIVFDFGNDFDKKEAHWVRDKNLRDVLVHLYEWHQLLLNWVEANLQGTVKAFLPEPYTWKTYGTMNVELFWKNHQDTPYEEAKTMLQNSHNDVLELIKTFSDDELFTKGTYKWTGGSTLGSYCVSVTSSHYDWAIKKLKAHIKASKKNTADL